MSEVFTDGTMAAVKAELKALRDRAAAAEARAEAAERSNATLSKLFGDAESDVAALRAEVERLRAQAAQQTVLDRAAAESKLAAANALLEDAADDVVNPARRDRIRAYLASAPSDTPVSDDRVLRATDCLTEDDLETLRSSDGDRLVLLADAIEERQGCGELAAPPARTLTAFEAAVLDAMASVDPDDLQMAVDFCETDSGDPLYPAMKAELARREAAK